MKIPKQSIVLNALAMRREGLVKKMWVDSKANQWGAEDTV